MRYWWRRALNILTIWLYYIRIPFLPKRFKALSRFNLPRRIGGRFRKYSIHYCIDCKRHWPFSGCGKLVSRDHGYKRIKHSLHITRSFGWRGKPPSKYLKAIPVYKYNGPPTPDEFGLDEFIEETGDQGPEGSCGGWGDRDTAAIDTKLRGIYPKGGWSWRCAYNGGRAVEGRLQEEGVFLKDVAAYRVQRGLCTFNVWPSKAWEEDSGSGKSWYADPSVVVHPDDLAKGKVKGFQLITTMEDFYGAIYTRHAVYAGLDWDDVWMNVVGLNMPKASGNSSGGHSIAFFRYSRKTGRSRLQNSWTKFWGKLGLGDMLNSDLEARMRSGEFIVYIYNTEPDPGPEPDPDDWLDKLQKLFEAFMKALTDLFGSMPKKTKKRKARR